MKQNKADKVQPQKKPSFILVIAQRFMFFFGWILIAIGWILKSASTTATRSQDNWDGSENDWTKAQEDAAKLALSIKDLDEQENEKKG